MKFWIDHMEVIYIPYFCQKPYLTLLKTCLGKTSNQKLSLNGGGEGYGTNKFLKASLTTCSSVVRALLCQHRGPGSVLAVSLKSS